MGLNGVVGFGQDDTSNDFLTPLELRLALQEATDDGARKLDLLHYDGCSFGLLEDAAIARGLAHYIVASANTGWGVFAYDAYRQRAGSAATPLTLARAVAETYAIAVGVEERPYTIAALDMAHFEAMNRATSDLGDALLTYVKGAPAARIPQVSGIRNASQLYDSGGLKPLELDPADSYVDLGDFARKLTQQLPEPALVNATVAVSQTLSSFVVYQAAQSGSFLYFDPAISAERSYSVSLEGATGLGVFYPPAASTAANSAYQAYVKNRLFDTTRDSGWNRWLGSGLASQGDGPVLENDTLIPPLVASQAPPATHVVYLPLVER